MEFPTLALDKERFTTLDLNDFKEEHPELQEMSSTLFLSYFALEAVLRLEFIDKPIKEWTMKEVLLFVENIDLNHEKENFYKNKMKGRDLVALGEEDLRNDLGLNVGDRKKLLFYIALLKDIRLRPRISSEEPKHQ